MRWITRYLIALAAAAAALAPVAAPAIVKNGLLRAPVTLASVQKEGGVRAALNDLARDCRKVLGGPATVREGREGDFVVRIDPSVAGPEGWRIETGESGVRITGSDELGVIYGIYQFSQRFLAVDPYWFWKDRAPAAQQAVKLAPQKIESTRPTFRYRGWFINDEDLLSEWQSGGGRRDIDYPFYSQVIPPEVADRIFETLLRAGGNLVIPASFVDVMNPPEAALVRRAAERGLYVTQHHIEPLGVSHFGFENFWKARGEKLSMSYSTQPEKVRETWRAYAAKWRELAGDHVVWQLGLRGRGDRPVWTADKGVKESDAGRLISRAMADQLRIVREVDPRPAPPVTTTLWLEGSQLMARGELTIPEGVMIIFADEGKSQTMQEDFHKTVRRPGRAYGIYYHIAFWSQGPHLVQGTRPEKLKRVFDEIVAKGDMAYAILNVSNIREHVLGVQAASEIMTASPGWDPARFMERFAPPALQESYRDFLGCFVELGEKNYLQDGYLSSMTADLRQLIGNANPQDGMVAALRKRAQGYAKFQAKLQNAIARLDRVIRDYPGERLTPGERNFFDVNLLLQARVLRGLYQYLDELLQGIQDRSHLAAAEKALAETIAARRRAEQGQWVNWFRGDKKMNLPRWLEETRTLEAKGGAF